MRSAEKSWILRKELSEASFVESRLPLQAFATLTLRCAASAMRLDDYYARWIRAVQAHNRITIGWIRAYELLPMRHIHAALVAAAPLDCTHASLIWQQIAAWRRSDAAKVEPYKFGIGGLDYVTKSWDTMHEDLAWSDNITAFDPDAEVRFFGTGGNEPRQMRRIRAQCLRAGQPERIGR